MFENMIKLAFIRLYPLCSLRLKAMDRLER